MSIWKNFNDAPQQTSYDLIPKGVTARVRMTLKPGGYNDESQHLTGGYATQSATTGSVFLMAEFVVIEGAFARRKIWANIGLHSPNGPKWGDIGRGFLRAVLNSARNVAPRDTSPTAVAARCVNGFQDFDGIEFIARIDQEKDAHGELRNTVKTAIEPGHPEYSLGLTPQHPAPTNAINVSHAQQPATVTTTVIAGKPSWAK